MARPRGTAKSIEDKYISRSIRFPPGLWRRIEQQVPESGRSRFIREAVERALPPDDPEPPRPIWQIFEDVMRDVPQEDLDRLPPDLSEQLDHYIYGTRRTDE